METPRPRPDQNRSSSRSGSSADPDESTAETLTLRFVGEDKDGGALHELHASHVAEVLQGLVGLSSDFAKAGVFGDGPAGSELLVRPAKEGSFLIEVLRVMQDNPEMVAAGVSMVGGPTLGQVIWWATKSARAEVSDYEYLANGNVKLAFQDNTAWEVPPAAWAELQKRERRRKKQLRQIMAPLSDGRVTSVEVQSPLPDPFEEVMPAFTLTRPDYDAVRPDDEVYESANTFETEARMSAIDFDNPTRWRVKTRDATRAATVEDAKFLGLVAAGLAIRKTDLFRLRVREDTVEKNGKTRRYWTVIEVQGHRRAGDDDDT